MHGIDDIPPFPSPDWAYFLDLDGTLVPLAARPDEAVAPAGLTSLLDEAGLAAGGALAVVSGRPIVEIDRILAPVRMAASGAHGLELRHDPVGAIRQNGSPLPDHHATNAGPPSEAVRSVWRPIVDPAQKGMPGLLVEEKPAGVALHYRADPELASGVKDLASVIAMALGQDWHVLHGHMVAEVKPRAINKGLAVEALMEIPPFRGRRPVFIGDDVTDEDGFAAVEKVGGFGIRVGPGRVETAARYRLPNCEAVASWLAALVRQGDPTPKRAE